MNPVSVLIADDEPLARRRMRRLLAGMPDIEIVGEAVDVAGAVQMASAMRPDILLLDIQMPGGSGFEVVEQMADTTVAVIFVTAFDHHALEAFNAAAVDYVTKPVEPGRLALALSRAIATVEARQSQRRAAELADTVSQLRQALKSTQTPPTHLWVRAQGQHVRIAGDKIVSIQAERDYASIRTDSGEYLYGESLAALEKKLDQAEFLRIHRSAIVRVAAVSRLKSTSPGSLTAVMSDGSEQRIGRTYLKAVRQRFLEGPGGRRL